MKKTLLYFSLFILSSSLIAGITLVLHSKPFSIHSAKGRDGEDIEGFYKWEVQRLADPATGKIPDNIRNLELGFASALPNDLHSLKSQSLESSSIWQMRGPWNIGGRTRAFAPDITNEGILLAGTAAGGMWRSADSGKDWTLTTQLATQQSVSCLAQDTRTTNGHNNVWYYGSGECYGASASATGAYYLGNGVYRSTDDGQTWTSLASTAANTVSYASNWEGIWSIATDPTAPDSLSIVYASCLYGAIFRSVDSGTTWTPIFGSTRSTSGYYTNVIVTSTGIVYATISSDGTQKGIWRSADGINFTNITPPNFPLVYNRIVMSYAPTDPNQLYFLANTPGYGSPDTNFEHDVEWNSLWKYKYLSGDGDSAGGVWINLSANLPDNGGLFDKYNCQGSYDMVVQFLPNDTSTVFIGGTDIFRSTSGFFDTTHTNHIGGYGVGASLPDIQVYPGDHPDQHVLFFSSSNPYIMYSSCDGGLFKTLDDTATPITWTTFNNGYVTTMFYTVVSNHETPGSPILVGGLQDNDCIFDNSLSVTNPWTKPIFGDGSFNIIADSGKLFYYETTTGKLFKTQMDTINGTVAAFNRMDPIGAKNEEWLNPYVIDPNNNNLMYYSGGKYLWRNNNLAGIPLTNMWDSISTNWVQWPDSVPTAGSYISAMAISTYPANRVYYGTSFGNVYRVDSANTGFTKPINITGKTSPNQFPAGAFVTCIAVDPANGNNLLAVFSNYATHNLFYSTDSGATWTYTSGNLNGSNQPSMRWAAIQHLPSGGTIYWVAASTGLYATDSLKGKTTVWVQQATNSIGNAVCDMVDVRPSDGLVAVATHTHGAYTANITNLNQITTIHNIAPSAEVTMGLYPNPCNGKAILTYYLPIASEVELEIFDGNGKLISQTTESQNTQGNHLLPIDISQQKSGIYFCRLQAGSLVKTEKLLLLK